MAVWVSGLEITPSVTVALFDRTSRRVVLSQACRAVLGQARRALTESDRGVSLARLAARGDWGELAISVLPAVTLALLPAIIRAYRDAHSAIGVRISESFDDEQLAALTAGRIDADRHPHWKKAFQASSAYFLWPLTLR